MKKIKLTYRELVWETREMEWGEDEWEDFIKWMSQAIDKDNFWHDSYKDLYEKIKDMSWEEVVADFEDPKISVKVTRSYADGTSWSYDYSLYDAICEAMREDCYDTDIVDTDYADDSYDEYEVYEVPEEQK